MSTEVISHRGGYHAEHIAHHNRTEITVFGFWIYIMSDCVLFASIFATFAVLSHSYAGGPTGRDIFELPYVAVETALLLLSSVTYGGAMLAMQAKNKGAVLFWLAVTWACGAGFIGMEVNEFHKLIMEGHGPTHSGFLSAFFTLVGTHGTHVTFGLIWMAVMMTQVATKGLSTNVMRRLMCLSLFWHFLDVVWIGVFTIVYLMGVM